MKTFKLLLATLFVATLCACSSSNDDDIVPESKKEDVYYVHYEVTCTSNNPKSIKRVWYVYDNGSSNIIYMPDGTTTKWEGTFNIKEGQHAGLACSSDDDTDCAMFRGRIEIRKNDSPFILKAECVEHVLSMDCTVK